jgi:hypothetical protein
MSRSHETIRSLVEDPAVQAVELKITVREEQEGPARAALELDEVEPEDRRVYFFDTDPGLQLVKDGLVLRARVVRDGADDSTVKLRPVVPDEIEDRFKRMDGFEIELDAVGEALTCSAKLSADQRRDEIDEVAAGTRPLRRLFSEDQERLIDAYAPRGVEWDDLSVLGPVHVRKWELEPKGFPHEVTVEEWVLPDGSNLIELSTKVEPGDADEAERDFDAFLRKRKIDPEGDQQTKTRTAPYFTGGAGS